MKALTVIILLNAIIVSLLCSPSLANVEEDYYNQIRSAIELLKKEGNTTEDAVSTTNKETINRGANFPCEFFERPPREKITVHTLTPYDINVVGGIGDSITAAFGARSKSLLDLFDEARGVSWSIGGDESLDTITTLPNIIKKYNPDLKGFSTNSENHFNVAVSGAVAKGMLPQAERLVEEMRRDEGIDFNNDWKVVTLWIGGNNLCQYCGILNVDGDPDNYANNIEAALDYLHEELPRTFVNLVQIIDVTKLNILDSYFSCSIIHLVTCPCARTDKDKTISLIQQYQEKLSNLIESGKYDDKDDFTVVIQPFFEGVEVPLEPNGKADLSYFAPDCFHFSEKAHREAAIALWDNMIQPVGDKNKGWTVGGDITCPTKDKPYFYTSKNSRPTLFKVQLDTEQSDKSKNNHYGGIMIGALTGAVSCSVMVVIAIIVIIRLKRSNTTRKDLTEKTALIS